MRNIWLLAAFLTLGDTIARSAEPPQVDVSPGTADDAGVIVHRLTCDLQAAATELRILLPQQAKSSPHAEKSWPVVYLLPVEPGRENRFGDAMAEAVKLDAADRHGAIIVQPTFAALPWYADHPTERTLAQETYFVDVVVPAVERLYPASQEPRNRRLVGFSKSGWGAWSLLLGHPDKFGKAASWDAPLTMGWPSKYGSAPIFGTEANFEKYQITRLLDERAAPAFSKYSTETNAGEFPRPRFILLGYGNFTDHEAIHRQLDRLGVPHVYRDGPQREHVWSSGWLAEALEEVTK